MLQDVEEDFSHFFHYKWDRPAKDVHEVGKNVRMRCVVKLLDIDLLTFELDNRSLIVVDVAVIRRGEYCDDYREA